MLKKKYRILKQKQKMFKKNIEFQFKKCKIIKKEEITSYYFYKFFIK